MKRYGMVQVKAPLLVNRPVARDHYWMRLLAPAIAKGAQPGQFIHLRCGLKHSSTIPLLRRPLSLLDTDPKSGTIDLIYKVVGVGTRALAEIPVGAKLDTLGPLGNRFEVSPHLETAYLMGGGVGIPPLVLLAKWLRKNRPEVEVTAFLGARTKEWVICTDAFRRLGVPIHVATDDGTLGYKGSVVDLLASVIARPRRGRGDLVFKPEIVRQNTRRIRPDGFAEDVWRTSPRQGGARNDVRSTALYICGPTPMMRAAAGVAHRHKLPAQVSLEERMGCALGCCWGCVVEVATEPAVSHARFQRVCTEGPVFPAEAILWRS